MPRYVRQSNLEYPENNVKGPSYRAFDKENEIGVRKLLGKRKTQEDRIATGVFEFEGVLSEEEWIEVLQVAIRLLEEELEKSNLVDAQGESLIINQGSCLASAVLVGDKAYTANIGDSYVLAANLQENAEANVVQLNKNLHSASNQQEQERVEREGGRIIRDDYGTLRLNNRLNLTRAIGDLAQDGRWPADYSDDEETGCGLSHEPDIYQDTITISSKGFLVLACDGILEHANFTLENIGQILTEKKDESVDKIADEIARGAYDAGSRDNLSVIVIPINPENKKPRYAAVFDGHGGGDVAQFLEDNFAILLDRSLNMVLQKKLTAKAENEVPADYSKAPELLFASTPAPIPVAQDSQLEPSLTNSHS